MSDDTKLKFDHLSPEAAAKAQATVKKLEIIRELKKFSNESGWSPIQEMLQEIVAAHTVTDPNNLPPITLMIEQLKKEIEARYNNEEEFKQLLLDAIPTAKSVREWFKKDTWNDAVWSKIRADGLFTKEKRAQMIESLRMRGMDKSDTAAKIWLTLSGDYSEKMDINTDKTHDAYREINKILHSKKE
jgi:hypothetical protein